MPYLDKMDLSQLIELLHFEPDQLYQLKLKHKLIDNKHHDNEAKIF